MKPRGGAVGWRSKRASTHTERGARAWGETFEIPAFEVTCERTCAGPRGVDAPAAVYDVRVTWYDWARGPVREWQSTFREEPELSSSGRYVAWRPLEEEGAPEGALRVSDARSDDELCMLVAPGAYAGAWWLSDERLLVARDTSDGARLTMYELPSGEPLAECGIGSTVGRQIEAEVTPDGRVMLVGKWPRDDATRGHFWFLDGASLAVRARVHRRWWWGALHPDGERLATTSVGYEGERREMRLQTLPEAGPVVAIERGEVQHNALRWAGRDEVRVLYQRWNADWYAGAGPRKVATVDVRTGAVSSVELAAMGYEVAATLSSDGARVLRVGLEVRSGTATASLVSSDAKGGATLRRSVVEVAARGTPVAHSVSAHERALTALVIGNRERGTLCAFDAERGEGRVVELPLPPERPFVGYRMYGSWLVEPMERRKLRYFDLEALGLR